MLKEGEEGKKSWEVTQEKGNREAASDQTSLDLRGLWLDSEFLSKYICRLSGGGTNL